MWMYCGVTNQGDFYDQQARIDLSCLCPITATVNVHLLWWDPVFETLFHCHRQVVTLFPVLQEEAEDSFISGRLSKPMTRLLPRLKLGFSELLVTFSCDLFCFGRALSYECLVGDMGLYTTIIDASNSRSSSSSSNSSSSIRTGMLAYVI